MKSKMRKNGEPFFSAGRLSRGYKSWASRKAHRDSSRIEFECRRHPETVDARLRAEIDKSRGPLLYP